MLLIDKKTKQIEHCSAQNITSDVLTSTEPLILKGLVADWPLTKLGRESAHKASEYLLQFYNNKPVNVALGEPSTKGRIFYSSDFTGFNYQSLRVSMKILLDKLEQHSSDSSPPTIYMASTMVDHWLPEFRNENDLLLAPINPLASIWIGNKTRIAAHYDLPDNIACSAVGRRRFTLFPPEQMDNLYPGPIDLAPGGQSISLIDFHEPDFEKYPKFHQAIQAAQVAELEPGDAIFIPSMWWHHVESLDTFGVLVNYWWRQSPRYMSSPMNTLNHALLTMRHLPPEQKAAWKDIFNRYIFDANEQTHNHIPEEALGILGSIDEELAKKIQTLMLDKLK
ncbi:cupin-like domain-containing protein [Porticoccaceae bacterium nBUS_17]